MASRAGFLFVFALLILPSHGQEDGPIKMTPEFALTFPVVKVGKDVTVQFPVLTNPAIILTPGMILRVLYVPPRPDDTQNLVLAHKGDMEQSFSRSTMSSDETSKMPPEIAHLLEGYRRTVWDDPNHFRFAMTQFPTDNMHLIYSPTGKNQDLSDSRFSFFEGLLIGLPNGKVTVLAVEDGSKADTAGFKAGDEILTVGDLPTKNDLQTFVNDYVSVRRDAKDSNAADFPLTVRTNGQTRVLKLDMPPTIKSQLMNGF